MELTRVRGLVDRLSARLPPAIRASLKQVYQRRAPRRPVDLFYPAVRARSVRRPRAPEPLRTARSGPLPSELWSPRPLDATSSPKAGDRPHLCIVAAGDLDPRLKDLLACEREGVPIVCLAADGAALETEIAGIASAIVVPTAALAERAGAVLPEERVAIAPTLLPAERLPARGLRGRPSRDVIVSAGDPGSGTFAEGLPSNTALREIPLNPDVALLSEIAGSALAVHVPTNADPTRVAEVAALATCGVPVIGHVPDSHPLAGLVAATRFHGHLPADPTAAVVTLLDDPHLRHAAGVRARRYGLAELSSTSAMRSVLPRLDQPVADHGIVAVTPLTDPAQLPRLAANLRRQRELTAAVLVVSVSGAHTVAAEPLEELDLAVQVVRPGHDLRRTLRRSAAEYVAVLDPTCWYGADHLRDLRLARETSGFAVIGRLAHHRCAPDGRIEVISGPEEAGVDHLAPGGSLIPVQLARSGLGAATGAEELTLHEEARKRGAHLYAIHRFGFLRPAATGLTPVSTSWDLAFPDGDGGVPLADAK